MTCGPERSGHSLKDSGVNMVENSGVFVEKWVWKYWTEVVCFEDVSPWPVTEATASLSLSITDRSPNQSWLSEWVTIAFAAMLPDFHFNAFQMQFKQFHFQFPPHPPSQWHSIMRPPPTSPPPLLLTPPPHPSPSAHKMNSPDRCHSTQDDNLPFGNQSMAPLYSLKMS